MSETTSATEASKSGIPTPSVPTIIELASNLILFISAAILVVAPAIVNLLSQSHTSWSKYEPLALPAVLLITLALACIQTLFPTRWRHPAGVLVHAIIWHGISIYYYIIDVYPALPQLAHPSHRHRVLHLSHGNFRCHLLVCRDPRTQRSARDVCGSARCSVVWALLPRAALVRAQQRPMSLHRSAMSADGSAMSGGWSVLRTS
ncbi:hypothetical protein BDR07DRAFT_401495 [Suillus spraguei]|nr:hypothetical protein BDR07DRAFT_401495 [Suillus spraguei]